MTPSAVGRIVRGLVDGYGLDGPARRQLADTLAPRTWSMFDLLRRGHASGEHPWARLWGEGHGTGWRRDAEWIEAHADALDTLLG